MSYPELLGLSNALAKLTADVAPRIIAVQGADGRQVSGFIWRTGLAVTAHEMLEGDDEVAVLKHDGAEVTAQLVGRDPSTDVALLKLETGDFAEWAGAALPAPGSLAVLAGRGEHSVLSALASVTEVGPAWRSMRGGEIDARITLGLRLSGRSEGSAVVAPDGGLIGMAVTGAGRRTLAIPASTIARAVATLSDKGYVPRGWLGVSLHPLGEDRGAIVVGLEPASPAANGGFLVGDIITTWGGAQVHSVGEVADRLSTGTVGSNISLGVLRGGSALELEITIGERPGTSGPVAQSVLGALTLGVAFDLTDPALEQVLRTLIAGRHDLFEVDADEAAVTITDRPASLGGIIGPHRVLRVGADEARRNAIDSLDPGLILAAAMLIGAGYALERETTDRDDKARLPGSLLPRLSQRERQVAELLVDGASNKVIARHLDISVHTAKFHVTAILEKLGARNRADAVSIILREGLVAI